MRTEVDCKCNFHKKRYCQEGEDAVYGRKSNRQRDVPTEQNVDKSRSCTSGTGSQNNKPHLNCRRKISEKHYQKSYCRQQNHLRKQAVEECFWGMINLFK